MQLENKIQTDVFSFNVHCLPSPTPPLVSASLIWGTCQARQAKSNHWGLPFHLTYQNPDS